MEIKNWQYKHVSHSISIKFDAKNRDLIDKYIYYKSYLGNRVMKDAACEVFCM